MELAAGQAERFGIRPGTVLGMARADRGTTTVEYVGVMAVVAVVISSVLLTPIGGSLRHGLAAAFCTVAGHDGCDVGSFVDGTVDPNDVRNRAPERCVVHSDSTDLNVELGLGRFAFVGESGRMLREIRSDGSIAVTLLGDLSGGGGVGGEGERRSIGRERLSVHPPRLVCGSEAAVPGSSPIPRRLMRSRRGRRNI